MTESRRRHRLPLWAALCGGVVIGLAIGPTARRLTPALGAQAPATPPAAQAPVVTTPRTFKAPVGLIFSSIKPAQASDFEAAVARARSALAASTEPTVRKQAEGWRFFKADEPGPSGSVLYVWLIDPTVPEADYTISKILIAAFPDDKGVLASYADAFAGPETLLNLTPLKKPD
ncbi:MAG TPA: hypothetical protein VIC33_04855 [Vicinamibacterales bacterium]|jgi:hypothetical protein